MAIESLNGTGGIEAFQRLVMSARMRNGGFDLPIGKTGRSAFSVPGEAVRDVKQSPALASVKVSSVNERPDSAKILGTRFDSYA
jgi:hypothetical protein